MDSTMEKLVKSWKYRLHGFHNGGIDIIMEVWTTWIPQWRYWYNHGSIDHMDSTMEVLV